jgi:hypothetical protein
MVWVANIDPTIKVFLNPIKNLKPPLSEINPTKFIQHTVVFFANFSLLL